jgi:hypothetical protein
MEINGISTVLAAKSQETDGEDYIFVWKKGSDKQVEHDTGVHRGRTWAKIRIIAQIFMLLASVAFVYQNFKVRFPCSCMDCPDENVVHQIIRKFEPFTVASMSKMYDRPFYIEDEWNEPEEAFELLVLDIDII